LKLVLVLLLAVNALLFSVASGWLNLWEARDPDRLRRQVDAERITVLSAAGAPRATQATPPQATTGGERVTSAIDASKTSSAGATGGTSGAASGVAPIEQSDNKPTDGASAATTSVPSTSLSCLEFPPLETDKAQSVEASMKQIGITVELKPIENSANFLVYLAPSESAKEAQRKLAELKRLGVTDAFLMQDGPLKFGISLGLFRAEEGAKALTQQLSAKGIRSAKISTGNALRNGKVTVRASGSEAQLGRVRQAASEANLPLKPCGG
jgi:hypothetical protein